MFAEKAAKGNSVQVGLNFPAKSLSKYTKIVCRHFVIN